MKVPGDTDPREGQDNGESHRQTKTAVDGTGALFSLFQHDPFSPDYDSRYFFSLNHNLSRGAGAFKSE
jgi:hypothetical protein